METRRDEGEKKTAKTAKIVDVLELSNKKAKIVLENSPFHPSGGGQPGDTGTLRTEGFRAEVRDAHKHEDSIEDSIEKKLSDSRSSRLAGSPFYKTILDLTLIEGKPKPGMEVVTEVDTARNMILSQMHTGQHLFSRLQENACEGLETLKVNIGVDESVVYVRYDGPLTWESLFELEEKTAAVIRADLPVESFLTSREEAEKIPELKAKWDRIHDERIRVVRVAGIDATACAGTHVKRTGEIGGFLVTGFNGSAPDWEVRFTVEKEVRVREYTRVMRRLLRDVGCRPDQLGEVFARQKAENAFLRQVTDKVRPYISIVWEEREVGNYPLYFALLSGLTKELLSIPARNCVAEHPNAFCLVLIPDTSINTPFPFILLRGAELPVDLLGLLKKFPELEARGGGKADWLNGTTTQRSLSVWFDCLKRLP
ncbi:MAG: alanyl-tRNA editing protein [Synergistaceae bacterium]|jgi:alanyl-tRNA synthetase|nr:alanyl-tRNA editing protein [Synergistaceae bacterium]